MEKCMKKGISANGLRWFAMVGMLLDHIWGTLMSGHLWMTCLGRMVFPIYAFQLAEGFVRTHDRKKYALRLLVFALISEIPFDLMMSGGWFFPFHQNTIFTLLLGFWVLWALEELREKRLKLWKGGLHLLAAALLTVAGFPDYGWQGVLTVVLFYLFREGWYAKPAQLAGMILLHVVWMEGQTLPWLFDLPLQSFALLALIPIWLYDGRKGRGGKLMQYGAYLYYPLHLLLLVFLRRVL